MNAWISRTTYDGSQKKFIHATGFPSTPENLTRIVLVFASNKRVEFFSSYIFLIWSVDQHLANAGTPVFKRKALLIIIDHWSPQISDNVPLVRGICKKAYKQHISGVGGRSRAQDINKKVIREKPFTKHSSDVIQRNFWKLSGETCHKPRRPERVPDETLYNVRYIRHSRKTRGPPPTDFSLLPSSFKKTSDFRRKENYEKCSQPSTKVILKALAFAGNRF